MKRSGYFAAITLGACASCGVILAHAGNMSFLDDTALVYLGDADRRLQNEAVLGALEDSDPNASRQWKNPASGYSGQVQALGDFRSEDGMHCRRVKILTQAKGIESQFALPACKTAAGEWFIASGKKLSRVKPEASTP